MQKIFILVFYLLLNIHSLFAEESFPNKPIQLVVGFGVGGSSDRLARVMEPFLHNLLKTPIKIINFEAKGSKLAASYFLAQPDDGYTIFCSTFNPYLAHTILVENAPYSIDDFTFINLQWFDKDIIAVNIASSFYSLKDLLVSIKKKNKKLTFAVMEDSSGHLLLKMLLHYYKIDKKYVTIKLFNNGKTARDAIKNQDVDAIIISSQGSELIRENIRTLAVFSDERDPQWDVPTVNEALKPLGFQVPLVSGSMRGFAVQKSFEKKHPKRYAFLVQTFLKILAKKEVQKKLRNEHIGGVWIGPKKSQQLIHDSFNVYKQHAHFLRN